MNSTVRTAIVIVVALFFGSLVNFGLVLLGPIVVSPPPGVDMSDMDSFAAAVDSMGPAHFLFPFLAHALGTLTACLLVTRFAAWNKLPLTYAVGAFFLLGGITAASMIPAPLWFVIVDLLFAYLPMAWLATKIITFPEDSETS